jgi:hypothetical protein
VKAPPYAAFERDEHLKGVDDHLANGGSLDELETMPVGINTANYYEWQLRQTGRKDGVLRDARVLAGLAVHADLDGKIRKSLATVARAAAIPKMNVTHAIESLERRGVIEIIDGSLEEQFAKWAGNRRVYEYDFAERPTIIILPPELRANAATSDEAKAIVTADYFEQRRSLGRLTALERDAWERDQRGEKQPSKAHRDAFRRVSDKREAAKSQALNPSI